MFTQLLNRRKQLERPPKYVLASMLCSAGGLLFGMDTGSIGPVTVMDSFVAKFGTTSATVHGLIVSAILISAATTSFFGGRVADLLGRPKGIALGALIFGAGCALEAGAVHIAMFVVGRVVEGIGEGIYLGTMVVYICEISPPKHRGPLTTGPQLLITLGLVVGYFTCYGAERLSPSISWRLPYAVLSGLSVTFSLSAATWLPHSPRWLTLRGRKREATAAWDFLEVNHADREKAEDDLAAAAAPASNTASQTSLVVAEPAAAPERQRFLDVFSSAHAARPRLAFAVFLMAMQQLSGIDGVLYYAPLLFTQAGLSSNQATFLASGVSALVIFAVTVPALVFADRWSRRGSTIAGALGVSATMFLIGALYASDSVHASYGAGRWVVIVAIYVFAVIFSLTWACHLKTYAAEIQPQRTRATATNISWGGNWLTNFLVALATPIMLARSSFAAYFFFGSCTLFTAIVCWVFMPETRGRSLDEIEDAFKSHTHGSKAFMRGVRRLFRMAPAVSDA